MSKAVYVTSRRRVFRDMAPVLFLSSAVICLANAPNAYTILVMIRSVNNVCSAWMFMPCNFSCDRKYIDACVVESVFVDVQGVYSQHVGVMCCILSHLTGPIKSYKKLSHISCSCASHLRTTGCTGCHTILLAAGAHPALTQTSKAGTRYNFPGWMEGWVDLVVLITPRPGIEPTTAWSKSPTPQPLHQ